MITGIPDTRMPMMISRMRCFLVIFINCGLLCRQRFRTISKRPFCPGCEAESPAIGGINFFKSISFIPTLWYKDKAFFKRFDSCTRPFFRRFHQTFEAALSPKYSRDSYTALRPSPPSPSFSFNRRFLHQHSQSPTKSMDYNFVPF